MKNSKTNVFQNIVFFQFLLRGWELLVDTWKIMAFYILTLFHLFIIYVYIYIKQHRFAFVQYDRDKDAEAARVELDGKDFGGNEHKDSIL